MNCTKMYSSERKENSIEITPSQNKIASYRFRISHACENIVTT